ncbi:uncharacterized protein LOC18423123 [Amborella trichopoda]|uniref:Uncharacterized protein n=1 Tax=Amborella trichopoda TaxID=13333 RepID=W1NJ49_AMBTC|nr:uncharacterized protein LOC18423123 [Amborella trichopoda]ERM95239.1 hypothetical protein AMTR_s00009p00268480 [Amborella trichopoda]|eukprot:XP_006827823.1 uncharacterized protein LOC18423123 [Amborella trichopoda]
MTHRTKGEQDDEDEEEEEEEEEEDRFFESLDRIPSSSASGSETEDDSLLFTPSANPATTMVMSQYEVWMTEPAPVGERRMRLLQEMGLSHDRALTRLASVVNTSANSSSIPTETSRRQMTASECSTSGRAPPPLEEEENRKDASHCKSSSRPAAAAATVAMLGCPWASCDHISTTAANVPPGIARSRSDGGTTCSLPNNGDVEAAVCPQRHAVNGKGHRGGTRSSCEFQGMDDDDDDDDDDDRDTDAASAVCKIKNLDNGKEFIVNEFREDGTWDKLREVGTGRQLTMEEFEMCVGHSPIVQELMRREGIELTNNCNNNKGGLLGFNLNLDPCRKSWSKPSSSSSSKKRGGGWLKSLKVAAATMAGGGGGSSRDRRSSDERDTCSEKGGGGRRSSSATDDSQDASCHTYERTRVRQYGKSCKELTALYMNQEIQAHKGSIWTIKFSLDGRYLASAGEDRVIHIWQVMMEPFSSDRNEETNPCFYLNGSPDPTNTLVSLNTADNQADRMTKRGRVYANNRKYANSEHVVVPENVFMLSEKPVCSFQGHLDDVLDLSWSKSQFLLSSSMDKTVRLWDMSSKSCIKIFAHNDYVTSIQFNPNDDKYFISGSLDSKVRIWSIPDRQVVDWSDLHEMVTAACYTPDGEGALVGSHKGSCRLYRTSGNKLQQESQLDVQSKKKRSHSKKITGFQFAPGNSSEVLITSADSRIRVFDGVDLVHKFKGFRNTSSQISASFTANGKYLICASEDSHVYMWRYDNSCRAPGTGRSKSMTRSYEHFHCRDVSAAIPWPGIAKPSSSSSSSSLLSSCARSVLKPTPLLIPPRAPRFDDPPRSPQLLNHTNDGVVGRSPLSSPHGHAQSPRLLSDRGGAAATWPEEKLVHRQGRHKPSSSSCFEGSELQARSATAAAWGLVVITAGLGGELRAFQNFGLPVGV